MAALRAVRNGAPPKAGTPGTGSPGKAATLLARADLAEVHLSLWCASPRVSMMEQLKP
jgi:hypothetical protein